MFLSTKDYFLQFRQSSLIEDTIRERFFKRVLEGKLTRDENSTSHCCAMFIPYDPKTKKIFLTHHKKANSWIPPGGHIDPTELPYEAAVREATEELGVQKKDIKIEGPFALQVLDIDNPPQKCREHYDTFYAFIVDPQKITVNPREFNETKWVTVDEAMMMIELKYYRKALKKFQKFNAL